jgi:hypothetical protein
MVAPTVIKDPSAFNCPASAATTGADRDTDPGSHAEIQAAWDSFSASQQVEICREVDRLTPAQAVAVIGPSGSELPGPAEAPERE